MNDSERLKDIRENVEIQIKELEDLNSLKNLIKTFEFLLKIESIKLEMIRTRHAIKQAGNSSGFIILMLNKLERDILSEEFMNIPDTGDRFYNFVAKTVKTLILDLIKLELYEADRTIMKKNNENYHDIKRRESRIREIIKLVRQVLKGEHKLEELVHQINMNNIDRFQHLKKKTNDTIKLMGLDNYTGFAPKNYFQSIYEHIDYLEYKGLYKVNKEESGALIISAKREDFLLKRNLFELKEIPRILYHSTSIDAAKEIIKRGYFKARLSDYSDLDYNKLFFTPNLKYSKYYGHMGGIFSNYIGGERYIVFEVNLNDKIVYNWVDNLEYIIWGDVGTEIITKIHLADGFESIKELSVKELVEF